MPLVGCRHQIALLTPIFALEFISMRCRVAGTAHGDSSFSTVLAQRLAE